MSRNHSKSVVAKAIFAVFGLLVASGALAMVHGAASAGDDPAVAPSTTAEASPEPSTPASSSASPTPLPSQPNQPATGQQPPSAFAQPEEREGLKVSMTVNGTSRIAKLRSELKVGPGEFNGEIYEASGDDPEELDLEGDLELPPSAGYFVVFGFMPTTNTTVFDQVGRAKGKTRLDLVNMSSDVDMVVRLNIVLRDVKQDGVPLNVGNKCRTEVPAQIRIKGKVNLAPESESVIKSRYTIPRFSGCGVTEDLDPLITGMVSGPDNLLTSRMKMRCIACD